MGLSTHFFLGANSGLGFQNLFGKFSGDDYYDLLVLKGGPGIGKSTMMKKIGEAMEARGESVEYLHCSGDPDSLDGVHIPRIKTAIIDGTSPHIVEPKYPAAVDRYVNLGQFYNVAAAKRARAEIVMYSQACSEAYQRAYRALSAARSMEESAFSILKEGINYDKMMRRAEGIIAREIKGKGSGEMDRYRFLGSLTHQGAICRYDTAEKLCSRVYHLEDGYGFAAPMLERIHAVAHARGYSAVICPDAEHPDRMQHLMLPELGVAFVTKQNGVECNCSAYRRIHLEAMVDPQYRKRWKGRISFLKRMAKTLREEGIEALKEAKKAHDALEGAYRSHVDFDGVGSLIFDETKRIESYL